MRITRTGPGFALILFAGMLAAGACAQTHGRFAMDDTVAAAFRSGAIQPDLQYYYQGRDTMPYAIIGIDRSYSVPSRYWIAFDPEPEQLKKMSGNIYQELRDTPYGARIMDPDGAVVGIWYSNVVMRTVTVDQHNRTVQILFPNPENLDHPG